MGETQQHRKAMTDDEMDKIIQALEDNIEGECNAFNEVPPQNAREASLCHGLLTTQKMLHAVISHLRERTNP